VSCCHSQRPVRRYYRFTREVTPATLFPCSVDETIHPPAKSGILGRKTAARSLTWHVKEADVGTALIEELSCLLCFSCSPWNRIWKYCTEKHNIIQVYNYLHRQSEQERDSERERGPWRLLGLGKDKTLVFQELQLSFPVSSLSCVIIKPITLIIILKHMWMIKTRKQNTCIIIIIITIICIIIIFAIVLWLLSLLTSSFTSLYPSPFRLIFSLSLSLFLCHRCCKCI